MSLQLAAFHLSFIISLPFLFHFRFMLISFLFFSRPLHHELHLKIHGFLYFMRFTLRVNLRFPNSVT